jgi:hypothetical protein
MRFQKRQKARADRGDPPVREARCDQPDDLTILRVVEAAHDADRVAVEETPIVVKAKLLEDTSQSVRVRRGARHTARIPRVLGL